MKKVLIIYNPYSGNRRFASRLDRVAEICMRNDYLPSFFRIGTTELDNIVAEIPQYDRLLVSGGDGTVNQVINRLIPAEIDTPLGIVPSGTANDVASHLQVPSDTTRAVSTLLTGEIIEADLGKVNHRYFLNVATGGSVTTASQDTHPAVKSVLGLLGYYIKGLEQTLRVSPMPIVLKSEELEIDEDAMFFLVLNTPGAGGFKRIVPQAQIDDGLLDVVVLRKCLLHQLTPLIFQFGDENGSHLKSPLIHYFQTKHLHITSSSEFKTDLDGELGPEFPLDVQIIPRGIKIIRPRLV